MVVCSRLRLGAAALVVLTAITTSASAQIITGTVTGTIKDPQGGVIPGATVVLVSQTRGTKMAPVVTNAQGDFVVPNVTADTYTLQVSMSGFKTLNHAGISVSGADRVALPALTLEVGGAAETVNVTAASPQIQSTTGERSYSALTEQVQNLPLNGRSFIELTQFTPGVSGTARLGGGGANNVMMDGVSTMDTGNNAALLRLNVEAIAEVKVLASAYQAEYGRASGLQITAVTKSGTNRFRGSVYEVRRNSDWNANSWQNKQNNQPKTVSRQDDFGYSFSGPIGKPGAGNKLFFFFSQEWRPREAGGQVRQFRFPTAAERAGDFSATLDNNGAPWPYIRDASTGLPCSATDTRGCYADGGVVGKIPASKLYQIGLNILKQYPMPNLPDQPGINYNYQEIGPVVSYLNNQPVLRFDYQPFQALRTTFKYSGERQRRQTFPGTLPGYNDTQTHDPVVTTTAVTVNYSLNSTTFIEANYGYARNAVAGCVDIFTNCTASIPMSPASDKRSVGLGDLPMLFPDGIKMDSRYYEYEQLTKINTPMFQDGTILLPPTFNWGNRVANGPPNLPYPAWLNYNRTQDISISMTKVTGQHTLKAGFYNHHSHKAQNRGGGGPGSLNFANNTNNPIDAQYGFANAALGIFNQYTQLSRFMGGLNVYNNTEAYIQDNWKVSNKLTLDVGVRFVRQQPQYDSLGQGSNFLPDEWVAGQAPVLYVAGCANGVYPCSGTNRQAMNPKTGLFLGPNSTLAIGQLVPNTGVPTNGIFVGGDGIVKTGYKWPLIAPAPRLGFAYDLSGAQRFVFRGGFGIFFDRPDGNSIYGLVANPPNASSVNANFGQLQTLGTSGLSIQGPPALSTYEYEAKLPTSYQWNFGVQMALPWSSALDLEYVGQAARYQGQNVDINQVDIGAAFLPENQDPTLAVSPTPGGSAVPTDQMRAFKGYGSITQFTQRGSNEYHSIQSSFNRRFHNGLSFGLNYTLGLSFTGNAGARLEHDANGNLRYRADQAEADDILGQQNLARHTFKGNFVWDLPDLPQNGSVATAVGWVINDWQLSGVFTGGSGGRYTIGYGYQSGGGNVNITGSPNYGGRVVIVGDPGSGCSDNQYQQFNTAAFAGPAVNSVGLESGQNYMIGCPDHRWDFAIARNIRLGGSRLVQIRADLFNAFNEVIFTGRQTTMNLTSPTNQTITNPQYNPDGTLVAARIRPDNAGFGAVTGAAGPRSVQLQIRFQF